MYYYVVQNKKVEVREWFTHTAEVYFVKSKKTMNICRDMIKKRKVPEKKKNTNNQGKLF